MILLDTHVLIWYKLEPRKLSERRIGIAACRSGRQSGDLRHHPGRNSSSAQSRPCDPGRHDRNRRHSTSSGITVLPVTIEVAVATAHFPHDFPSDPMDRIIAATARAESLPLVTADERIQSCPLVKTIW